MLPGDTTLTMISSLAGSNERFIEMLTTTAPHPPTEADDDGRRVFHPEIHHRCNLHVSHDLARKAYYRSYSRRADRTWEASMGWFPVRLTVTAERRHACEDAVQTIAASRFKFTYPVHGGCARSVDVDGGALSGKASNR
jgi:hypothetical protein